MLKNYFKVAFRNLVRNKVYSSVNIVGLSLGLAVCFLILLLIRYELNFDRYNPNAEDIYRVEWTALYGPPSALMPLVTIQHLREGFPEIRHITALVRLGHVAVTHNDKVFDESNFFLADSSIFSVFKFNFLQGNPGTALVDPRTAVITLSTAHKYFGDADPIGKELTVEGLGHFLVSGVVSDMPPQSHFHADVLGSLSSINFASNPFAHQGWIYVLLSSEASAPQLVKKLNAIDDFAHLGWWFQGMRFQLEPLTAIHLYSHTMNEIEPGFDPKYLYILSAIAVLILLIASLNYTNIALLQSVRRSKEISLRKIFGGRRGNLIAQFLGESILVSIASTALAVLIVEMTLPWLDSLLDLQIAVSYVSDWGFLLDGLGIAILVGILSAGYPAFVLSSLSSIKVLNRTWISPRAGLAFRKWVVIVQFTLAAVLITTVLMVEQQLGFLESKNLGFDRKNVVVIPYEKKNMAKAFGSFKDMLLQYPGVSEVSACSGPPIGGAAYISVVDSVARQYIMVDPDYIPLLQMRMIEGRNFEYDKPSDSNACIISQTAVRAFRLKNPVGTPLPFDPTCRIIGVVNDFKDEPLKSQSEPAILKWAPTFFNKILIKINPANIPGTISHIGKAWDSFVPNQPFRYSFLDKDYDKLYRVERMFGTMAGTFASFSILVATIGLFGVSGFSTERRTKEIGIRKSLGASSWTVLRSLLGEYIWMIVLSDVISWPIAFYFVSLWLHDYAYRAAVTPSVFLLSAVIVLAVGLTGVGWNSIRAAEANPVRALRYE